MAKCCPLARSPPPIPSHPTAVICSDKTGTLTTNMMTVARLAAVAGPSGALAEYEVTGGLAGAELRWSCFSGVVVFYARLHQTVVEAEVGVG